jgi:hypothetical protein
MVMAAKQTRNKWNRIENLEINPHIYCLLIFLSKMIRTYIREKDSL